MYNHSIHGINGIIKHHMGQFFIQMIRERTGGDTILAIVQRALSLIQAGRLVEERDFQ